MEETYMTFNHLRGGKGGGGKEEEEEVGEEAL